MSRRRKVLILYSSPLFGHSLKSLLEEEEGLEVVTAGASGSEALLSFHPHVLIVEETAAQSQREGSDIPCHAPTIIRLSLNDNAMRVSYERQVPSADVQDLLAAVKSRVSVSGRPKQEVKHG